MFIKVGVMCMAFIYTQLLVSNRKQKGWVFGVLVLCYCFFFYKEISALCCFKKQANKQTKNRCSLSSGAGGRAVVWG